MYMNFLSSPRCTCDICSLSDVECTTTVLRNVNMQFIRSNHAATMFLKNITLQVFSESHGEPSSSWSCWNIYHVSSVLVLIISPSIFLYLFLTFLVSFALWISAFFHFPPPTLHWWCSAKGTGTLSNLVTLVWHSCVAMIQKMMEGIFCMCWRPSRTVSMLLEEVVFADILQIYTFFASLQQMKH